MVVGDVCLIEFYKSTHVSQKHVRTSPNCSSRNETSPFNRVNAKMSSFPNLSPNKIRELSVSMGAYLTRFGLAL